MAARAKRERAHDKALKTTPDDPRMLEYKGYALFRLGEHDEAMTALQAAHPSSAAAQPDQGRQGLARDLGILVEFGPRIAYGVRPEHGPAEGAFAVSRFCLQFGS